MAVFRRGSRVRRGPARPGGLVLVVALVGLGPRVDVFVRLPPAAFAIALVLSHLPRPRPDQGTSRQVMPALGPPAMAVFWLARRSCAQAMRFLIVTVCWTVRRTSRQAAGPALSVTTAVCRLPPGLTQVSGALLPAW